MQTTFLNTAGTVLFVRDDMEQGNWTQEEYSVNATFPYVHGKVIERGQRIAFRDPATNNLEIFEIRNVNNIEPEHYQQLIAEHIALSELADEHINTTEIDNKTASQALTTALTGTLWSVGTDTSIGTSSGDISRGSVWQAVGAIMSNWNVYITPRVTVNDAGSITGRYLDIAPAEGVWRGVRLSIEKNMLDSSVIYDDSEVLTALYGYGGNVDVPQSGGAPDKTEELTFADVVWTATSSHPAKPSGQTYIEDPEKTALYGRNGRARFGYYQNGDIKDADILLEKTWEALKATSEPKISISGSVSDLYRLGYADQPLRLHDTAIVEIKETGEKFQKEIIRLDVDLVDPTATRPEIGDYIPNIIYINRETARNASGGGGGGGGGRGQTKLEYEHAATYTEWVKLDDQIGMVIGRYDGEDKIEIGHICLAINESQESIAYIDADHINISATSTAHMLAGSIVYDANGNLVLKESSGGGVYVEHNEGQTTATFGIWDKGNLTGGVMVQQINGQTGTKLTLTADVIDIDGLVTALAAKDIGCANLTVQNDIDCSRNISANGYIYTESYLWADSVRVGSSSTGATWQSYTARYCSLSTSHYFTYASSSGGTTVAGTVTGRVVTGYTDTTIHYLGY